ncbi:MAG: hypothetical protein QXP42_02245 [Candidatus Micrarchaeia archaeon]
MAFDGYGRGQPRQQHPHIERILKCAKNLPHLHESAIISTIVLRRVAQEIFMRFQSGRISLPFGNYKIHFYSTQYSKPSDPMDDHAGLSIMPVMGSKEVLVAYRYKSVTSIAAKRGKYGGAVCRSPTQSSTPSLSDIETALSKLRAQIASFELQQSPKIKELLDLIERRQQLVKGIFDFVGHTRIDTDRAYAPLTSQILAEIDEISAKLRDIPHHLAKKENVASRMERVAPDRDKRWPLNADDAKEIVEALASAGMKEKLTEAISAYLEAELQNIGAGVMDYTFSERVGEIADGLLLLLRNYQDTLQNAQQAYIDIGMVGVANALNAIGSKIHGLENRVNDIKMQRDSGDIVTVFGLVCQAGHLRSDILETLYDTYLQILRMAKRIAKSGGDTRQLECVLDSIECMFFELARIDATRELKFWNELTQGPMGKKIPKRQRRAIARYIQHLSSIAGIVSDETDKGREEYIQNKKSSSVLEQSLCEKINELHAVSPIEAEALRSYYMDIKSHRRYKLGDLLPPPAVILTPEKLAQTALELIYAARAKGETTGITVFGIPLENYENHLREQLISLLNINARIIATLGDIPIVLTMLIGDKIGFDTESRLNIINLLDGIPRNIIAIADRVGYMDHYIHDMFPDLERLLARGSTNEPITIPYTEQFDGDTIIITLQKPEGKHADLFEEPITIRVPLHPSITHSAMETTERNVDELYIGERFGVNEVLRLPKPNIPALFKEIRESTEEPAFAYCCIVGGVVSRLEENTRVKAQFPNDQDLFYAFYSYQHPFCGVITRFGETAPAVVGGENTLASHTSTTRGDDYYNKATSQLSGLRRFVAMSSMADEMHMYLPNAIMETLTQIGSFFGP